MVQRRRVPRRTPRRTRGKGSGRSRNPHHKGGAGPVKVSTSATRQEIDVAAKLLPLEIAQADAPYLEVRPPQMMGKQIDAVMENSNPFVFGAGMCVKSMNFQEVDLKTIAAHTVAFRRPEPIRLSTTPPEWQMDRRGTYVRSKTHILTFTNVSNTMRVTILAKTPMTAIGDVTNDGYAYGFSIGGKAVKQVVLGPGSSIKYRVKPGMLGKNMDLTTVKVTGEIAGTWEAIASFYFIIGNIAEGAQVEMKPEMNIVQMTCKTTCQVNSNLNYIPDVEGERVTIQPVTPNFMITKCGEGYADFENQGFIPDPLKLETGLSFINRDGRAVAHTSANLMKGLYRVSPKIVVGGKMLELVVAQPENEVERGEGTMLTAVMGDEFLKASGVRGAAQFSVQEGTILEMAVAAGPRSFGSWLRQAVGVFHHIASEAANVLEVVKDVADGIAGATAKYA